MVVVGADWARRTRARPMEAISSSLREKKNCRLQSRSARGLDSDTTVLDLAKNAIVINFRL